MLGIDKNLTPIIYYLSSTTDLPLWLSVCFLNEMGSKTSPLVAKGSLREEETAFERPARAQRWVHRALLCFGV